MIERATVMTPKDLARLIRKIRKSVGLTQVELAGLCNVGNRFVVELEQGKPTIEIGKALHVACMLGIKLFHENKV